MNFTKIILWMFIGALVTLLLSFVLMQGCDAKPEGLDVFQINAAKSKFCSIGKVFKNLSNLGFISGAVLYFVYYYSEKNNF